MSSVAADAHGLNRRKVRARRSSFFGRSVQTRNRISMLDKKILHILLVEDDEVDVLNVRRAFDKNKITNPLYVAFNGIHALEMLRTAEVPKNRRLVLLDLNMPRMNGIEFLRELRKDSELRAIP